MAGKIRGEKNAFPLAGSPGPGRAVLFVALALARYWQALPAMHAAKMPPCRRLAALAHVPRFERGLPVLNDYAFGGYLIWNGVRPFIDSRADLYGDGFIDNYSVLVAPDKDALASTLTYYHVRWTIFSAHQPAVKLMDAVPGWHRLYGDANAVVHVKD